MRNKIETNRQTEREKVSFNQLAGFKTGQKEREREKGERERDNFFFNRLIKIMFH